MSDPNQLSVHATRWWKHEDHLKVTPYLGWTGSNFEPEGLCGLCNTPFHGHGWLTYKDDGFVICPGDWIIQVVRYPDARVKPGDTFRCTDQLFQVLRHCWNTFIVVKEQPAPPPEQPLPSSQQTIDIP